MNRVSNIYELHDSGHKEARLCQRGLRDDNRKAEGGLLGDGRDEGDENERKERGECSVRPAALILKEGYS